MNTTRLTVITIIALFLVAGPVCIAEDAELVPGSSPSKSVGQTAPGIHEKDNPANWQGLDFAHFADLAIAQAVSSSATKTNGVDPGLVKYAWDTYLTRADQLRTASAPSMFKLLSATIVKLTKEQKSQMAKLYYNTTLQNGADLTKIDGPHLILVGWVLISSGLYEQNQSFPEFAKAVAAHVRDREKFDDDVKQLQGGGIDQKTLSAAMTYLNPFWYREIVETIDDNACPFYRSLYSDSAIAQDYAATYFFGKALGTDADRQLLKDELVKPECGCPRTGPADVLTWSYKRTNELDKWEAFVEGKISDASIQEEARNRWILVRAYVEEAKTYYPSPWLGKPWVDKVLAAGPNEPTRQDCVEIIVNDYIDVGHFADGRKFLKQQAAATTSSDMRATFQKLDDRLALAQSKDDLERKESTQKEQQDRLAGEVAALQSRIKDSQARGDSSQQIETLQSALAKLQRKLEQTSHAQPSGGEQPSTRPPGQQ
jgi:hypothetical protein